MAQSSSQLALMSEPSCVVQVTKPLILIDGSEELQERLWKKRSIYKLPAYVTNLNPNAYKPQAVSFGPYHYGAPHLAPMEDHKRRALHYFLKRARKTVDDFVGDVSEVVQDLKDCYDSLDPMWHEDTDSFIRLMILDGCFMLEILTSFGSQTANDYKPEDPIFSNHGRLNIMPYIRRDMLMIENQLPMRILDILVSGDHRDQPQEKNHVNGLIHKFFSQHEILVTEQCLHVLDVYRKGLTLKDPIRTTEVRRGVMSWHGDNAIIRSAIELDEAGIDFNVSDSTSLKDISFAKGVLWLPTITVDDLTESMFLNILAFERFHAGAGNAVTSYIFIMDSIIDSEKDVALLHSKGIIQSAIGSNTEVAKLFNTLSRDTTPDEDNNKLVLVHRSVNMYCRKPWNAWRANLVRTYFRSPWAILSLIAAILLFALTIIQTIFTVFPAKNS